MTRGVKEYWDGQKQLVGMDDVLPVKPPFPRYPVSPLQQAVCRATGVLEPGRIMPWR